MEPSLKSSLEKDVSIISMHDFLDFLKLTCQVNEKKVDYDQLAKNELVNSLLVKPSPSRSSIGSPNLPHENLDKKGTTNNIFFIFIKYLCFFF